MSMSIVRIGPMVAGALMTLFAIAESAPAEPVMPPQNAVANDREEGLSADDVKDVFEGIQFVMFSIGVGAALYWFCCHYLPSKERPRIEFDVDVERVDENDVTRIIELVALVKNRGREQAELTELRYTLESVRADRLSIEGGSLDNLNALTPLFSGDWVPKTFVLDAGTQTRRAIAVAIPKTVDLAVVTAQVRNVKRTEVYDASRLIRLARLPRSGFVQ